MLAHRLALPAAIAAALLAVPAGASAKDFCVGAVPGCTGAPVNPATLDAALETAGDNGTSDRFLLAPGIISGDGFTYDSPEKLEIIGSGVGVTTLRSTGPASVLGLAGHPGTEVSDLTLEGGASTTHALDLLSTRATDVAFAQTPGTPLLSGVLMSFGARLDRVSIATDDVTGVVAEGGKATITDSDITSDGFIAFGHLGAQATLERVTLRGSLGVWQAGGHVDLRDALVDVRGAGSQATGIAVQTTGGAFTTKSITAERVTLVGAGAAGTDATALSIGASGGRLGRITFRDSIASGFAVGVRREASTGATAEVVTERSVHPDPVSEVGPGTTAVTAKLATTAAFADAAAGDFRLPAGSPLIDAGGTAAAIDRAGVARPLDGDGDCTARPDVGAYEHQPATAATCSAPPARPAQDPAAPAPPAVAVPRAVRRAGPVLSKLSVRRGRARFTLSAPAKVTLRLARRSGRRFRSAGSISVEARRGTTSVRLPKRRRGAYRVTVVAVDAAGRRSKSVTRTFRLR